MKMVLDSNVFVSSFFWKGKPRQVFDRVTLGKDDLYISDEILDEIAEVMLRPKFNAVPDAVREYIEIITSFATEIIHNDTPAPISRDADDDNVLQCALLGHADYIVTGDGDLLVLKAYHGTKIVTPSQYLLLTE
jgi:putative PIN family toxin of toxin-antitoxin system